MGSTTYVLLSKCCFGGRFCSGCMEDSFLLAGSHGAIGQPQFLEEDGTLACPGRFIMLLRAISAKLALTLAPRDPGSPTGPSGPLAPWKKEKKRK